MDDLADYYYNKHPGALGSTDRKRPLNIDALFEELNLPDSELATMWSLKEVASWAKAIGAPRNAFQAMLNGLRVRNVDQTKTY